MTKRLVGAFVGLVLAMLVLLGVPFLQVVERNERARLRTDLERDAVVLASGAEDELSEGTPDPDVLGTVAARYAERTGARVVIVDASGLLRADSSGGAPADADSLSRSMASRPEIQLALRGDFAAVTRHSSTLGYSSLFVAVPVASGGRTYGAVRVSFPTRDVDRRIAVQRTRLVGVGVVAAIGVALLGVWLARWLVGPVTDLAAATRRFGGGDLGVRAVDDRGPRELRDLAAEFNAMAARIDELVTSQNAFVADASHELRSPLTAIRLQLEAMEFGAPEAIQARRERALDEVTRLSRNVDGLLVLARQERAGAPIVASDLSTAVRGRAELWGPLMAERDIELVVDVPARLDARATPDRVATVLDNLVANAIDAAPDGSVVTLAAAGGRSEVVIHVRDQGPGMTAEHRLAAFDRFWRAGEQRSALGGSGLGLAIARKLVVADGGSICLEAVSPTGLDVVVRYPAGRAEGER